MAVIRWLLILALLFVLMVFGVENMKVIPLKFSITGLVDYRLELPLFLVVFIAALAGAIMAGIVGLSEQVRLHSRIRKQNKAIARLEGEVKTLRNLPLEEGEETAELKK